MSKPIQIRSLDPAHIQPSPVNKRRFQKDDAKDPSIVSLAESIRQDGQIEPILVRSIPARGGHDAYWELICGERRTRACRLLGIEVQAIERDLDDKQAAMLTAAENAERENLNPIEEAETFAELVDRGWTHVEIADHLKVLLHTVVRRMQLSNLSANWRALAAEPQGFCHAWRAPHFEKIAKFPPDIQDGILQNLDDREEAAGWTTKQLAGFLAEFLHCIPDAPWKKDDETLVPEAGSCVACKKRSDLQPDLFDDDDLVKLDEYGRSTKNVKKGARCLDVDCWAAKLLAHIKCVDAGLREETKTTPLILAEHTWEVPNDSPYKKRAVDTGAYEACKATDKGALPAVFLDGPRAGQASFVKQYEHRYGGNAGVSRPKASKKTLKEKRAQLEVLRSRILAGLIVTEYESVIESGRMPQDYPTLRAMAGIAVFGTHGAPDVTPRNAQWSYVKDLFVAGKAVEMTRMVFMSALEQIVSIIRAMVNESTWQKKPVDAQYLRGAADYLNVDYDALVDQAEKAKPEPKGWAKEAEEEAQAKKKKLGKNAAAATKKKSAAKKKRGKAAA